MHTLTGALLKASGSVKNHDNKQDLPRLDDFQQTASILAMGAPSKGHGIATNSMGHLLMSSGHTFNTSIITATNTFVLCRPIQLIFKEPPIGKMIKSGQTGLASGPPGREFLACSRLSC